MIGRALLRYWQQRGVSATVLTRHPDKAQDLAAAGFRLVTGDIRSPEWLPELQGHQAVVHLAGWPLFAKRWNAHIEEQIRSTRVEGTANLVRGLAALAPELRPQTLVSSSAVGYYGGTTDSQLFDESSPPVTDFLSDVACAWEAEAHKAKALVDRLTILRTGIVLSKEDGMLGRILPLFRAGMGGRVSSGKQWVSWIHHHDVTRALHRASLEKEGLTGTYNLCAPHPVTNHEMVKTLSGLLGRRDIFPLPKALLFAMMGKSAHYAITGQRVCAKRLLAQGFQFEFPKIKEAMSEILQESS